MTEYIHKKTGNIYTVEGEAIDCTNSRNDTIVVLYRNKEGMLFVREKGEFLEKFDAVK